MRVIGMDHIVVNVADVDEAVRFYFCLVVEPTDMGATLEELRSKGVESAGPAGARWGARGNGPSFYIQAPDGNKIELKCYTG